MTILIQKGNDILDRLQQSLDEISSETIEQHCLSAIESTKAAIWEFKELAEGLNSPAEEVIYFRRLWPKVYGKLFFHIKVYHFELRLSVLAKTAQPEFISAELRDVARWFREHAEFCIYYRSGTPAIDEMFTRAYSQGRLFDELALVIDSRFATLASYQAACCEAFTSYKLHLDTSADRLTHSQTGLAGHQYRFVPGKTAALELLVGLVETRSIEIDGKPATLTELSGAWEEIFQQDLKDRSVLLNQMDNRKKDPTPYTNSLSNGVINRRARLGK